MTVLAPIPRNAVNPLPSHPVDPSRARLIRAACLCLAVGASACTSINGRYEDANGTISLTIKGALAQVSEMGDVAECAARASGKDIELTCAAFEGLVTLRKNDDGTFSSPFGILTRRSS